MTDLTYRPGRTAVEAVGLGMRYRRRWALRDCSFRLPAGRVCALVGPNGAGKSTLLALAAGLGRPAEGSLRVLGGAPSDGAVRPRVAYVAQDKPLYPHFTVAETLALGARLNPGRWDAAVAERLVRAGGLSPDARAGSLSGGQRTRLALALAFGKRPELLLLDEPMSDLDPLVRHEMTAALMAEAAEYATTVVMASHVLAELEGVCDYLLLVADGRVRLAGEVEDLISAHRLVMGRYEDVGTPREFAAHTIVEARTTGRQFTALIRPDGPVGGHWEVAEPSLEELLLAHLRAPGAPALLAPSAEPRAGARPAGVAA
ncbi:ABC transporter ATP-binding protein [Streptomyces cinnamoneus]|uniref:ABC transporter ATP-binding protein n=1 Tax=Streptomyces cinnamoneus TaxID=53446 RepID=A0A2G1XKE0_STRCJ|nr:ABC transporter ATP-binding protein [Streptomyces cinnamoneus]PHQ51609.1 ABC transporter ATP-binding protein [Streptomyces cinnamoneus]PPT14402.1 ABC transporter ATP-binding protein [Streptomyces cinnamoneus]